MQNKHSISPLHEPILKDVLRAVVIQAPLVFSEDSAKIKDIDLLSLLRGVLTLIAIHDVDTNFFSLSFLDAHLGKNPDAKLKMTLDKVENMFGVKNIFYDSSPIYSIYRVVSALLLSNTAASYSPVKDSVEFFEDAVEFRKHLLTGRINARYLSCNRLGELADDDTILKHEYDSMSTALWADVYTPPKLELILHFEDSTQWAFWRDWYQGFLDGKPLDWNLQREVALIPDADWEKGPAHIADKIEEIKARFLADKAPLAEKLELNPETGKFFVTPVPARKPDLLNTTLEKAADALDDALNGRNGLLADDRVARVLHRCIEKYTHNPERIEMDFVDAHAGLTRQMASGELADSEEILSLAEVLKNGALDIRANHPDIAANRETRAARALQELTPEQKQQLEDAQPILEALTEGEAHQDMGADIPALINDIIGPVPDHAPPVGPAVRVVNRAAKMSLLANSKEAIEAIEKSSGFRIIRISLVLKSIIDIGLKIFGLF